ncbi:MAG: 50S ribosomal protein L11 methyltransferase, partial [Clostridiales bacterium]|nr:50S ribosomal protein L11 methyltransferase [Clostridiales bacterium]
MYWREVAVTVSPEGEETVADLFYQLGCTGVNIEDSRILQAYINSGSWDYYDFEETDPTESVVVKGYFADNEELEEKLNRLDQGLNKLAQLFPNWQFSVAGITLREENWATAWKKYFKPARIGRHILIKPSWEQVVPLPEDIVLEIDPGMA